ncbi:MAG: hypothetical protein ABEK59_12975 [Halobacteria archaeon]
MNVGDYVIDREVEDSNAAVVILTPDMSIDEWDVTDDETVADHNPDYGEGDDVVIVAFVEDLDEWWSDWREFEETELFDKMVEEGHKFYAFPRSRLKEVDESYMISNLDLIAEQLEEAGYTDYDMEDDHVMVEKFGEYRIYEDGTLEGEGSLRTQLEKVVQKVDLED